MPKSVAELAQLNTFSRSSDGGQLADTATRGFKVILNSPNEAWNVHAAIGYNIGDPYLASEPGNLPLVSVDVRADGDSRLVRIVTATFRNTPGGTDGSGGGGGSADRRSQAPEVRAPLYSISTSLQEVPAGSWRERVGAFYGPAKVPANKIEDVYDGVTKLEPVTTITIEQYSYTDGTYFLQYCGLVNSDDFTFSGLAIKKHQCLFQSVSSQGHVESFNGITFRGFKLSFVFSYKANQATYMNVGGEITEGIGWDMAVPHTGYNVKNIRLGDADVDIGALALQHENFVLKDLTPQVPRYTYAPGTQGIKVRAHIIHASRGEESGAVQGLAAQPVPLNSDGSPRKAVTDSFGAAVDPPVLVYRYSTQEDMAFGNNFSNFGINSFY
jgi:hypothetical protein